MQNMTLLSGILLFIGAYLLASSPSSMGAASTAEARHHDMRTLALINADNHAKGIPPLHKGKVALLPEKVDEDVPVAHVPETSVPAVAVYKEDEGEEWPTWA